MIIRPTSYSILHRNSTNSTIIRTGKEEGDPHHSCFEFNGPQNIAVAYKIKNEKVRYVPVHSIIVLAEELSSLLI